MINLPPGMKRRNPGTKKIALETPVRAVSLVTTQSPTLIDAATHQDEMRRSFKHNTHLALCAC